MTSPDPNPNPMDVLKQVQQMQVYMQAAQEVLASTTIDATVGGGVVRATVTGEGELRKGRKARRFRASEVPDSEKLPLLRIYTDKWAWEVKGFLGVEAGAPDEEPERIAPSHPAFVLTFED